MSPEFRAGERVENIVILCGECGRPSDCYGRMVDTNESICEACATGIMSEDDERQEANENMPESWDHFDDQDLMDNSDLYDDFEDDGQPTEYEEWQDLYGGDDWDHGQYDTEY
jgi:hypothetical protein